MVQVLLQVMPTNNTASTIVARDGSWQFCGRYNCNSNTGPIYGLGRNVFIADASYDPGTVVIVGGEAEVTAQMKKQVLQV